MPAPNVPPAEIRTPVSQPRTEPEPAERPAAERTDGRREDRITVSPEARAAHEREAAGGPRERTETANVQENRVAADAAAPLYNRRGLISQADSRDRTADASSSSTENEHQVDGPTRVQLGRVIDAQV